MNCDILGIGAVRWKGSDNFATIDSYNSGYDRNSDDGVRIVFSQLISQYVVNFEPYSERTIMCKFISFKKYIIQVYATTDVKSGEKIEEFYNEIEHLTK